VRFDWTKGQEGKRGSPADMDLKIHRTTRGDGTVPVATARFPNAMNVSAAARTVVSGIAHDAGFAKPSFIEKVRLRIKEIRALP
jgi:hypothetical protein